MVDLWKNVEPFIRKTYERFFIDEKSFLCGVYSASFIEKAITFTVDALKFMSTVAVFMSLGFIVFKWFLPKYGFEKTLLLLLMSLVAMMRAFLKNLKQKD